MIIFETEIFIRKDLPYKETILPIPFWIVWGAVVFFMLNIFKVLEATQEQVALGMAVWWAVIVIWLYVIGYRFNYRREK